MLLYKIVTKHSAVVLEEAVQNYIDLGWQPLGGVTYSQTTVHEGSSIWAQAMTIEAASDARPSSETDNW